MVKVKDLRAKKDAELKDMLADLNKEALNLRFQQATAQLANPARRRAVRKEIAKIKTIQTERLNKKEVS